MIDLRTKLVYVANINLRISGNRYIVWDSFDEVKPRFDDELHNIMMSIYNGIYK